MKSASSLRTWKWQFGLAINQVLFFCWRIWTETGGDISADISHQLEIEPNTNRI